MDPAAGADLNILEAIARALLIGAVSSFVLYLYFSITLMIIAQKSKTPASGLAWLPVLNLWLMCWIGRRSGWWVLALLLPGINIIVFALIWASMAAARGKPSWTGPLVLAPGLGLLIPAYLAAGQRSPDESASGPRSCGRCGARAAPADCFCGDCGQALPAPGPAGPKPLPLGHAFLVALLMLVLVVGATGAAGWYFLGQSLDYTPSVARQQPAIPQHLAGTLTEFPIDTGPDRPARPGIVISQIVPPPPRPGDPLPPPGSPPPPRLQVPPGYLPPGVQPQNLEKGATAITCVPYRSQPDEPAVNVSVLKWPGAEQAGRELAGSVTRATGGQQTGIRVQSPTGRTYTGSRIRTPQIVVFILARPEADIVLIIYAPSPAVSGTAERLARNVGNGRGLLDDPGFQSAVAVLPAQPPDGLVLQQVQTTTPEELTGEPPATSSGGSPPGPAAPPRTGSQPPGAQAEAERLQEQMSLFVPQRLTTARYADGSRRDWGIIIIQFGSARRALNVWLIVRAFLQAVGMTTTRVQSGTGLIAVVERQPIVLFQKGPYLAILFGPAGGQGAQLLRLADSLQM